MIKAVFIDIDNTLLDFNESAKQAMISGFKTMELVFEPYMFDVFLRVNAQLWDGIQAGTLSKKRLYELRWNTVFKELGLDIDGLAFEDMFRRNVREGSVPINGAEALLSRLRKKYDVYAVSNASYAQQSRRLEKADFIKYLTKLITSEQAGFAKPEKRFFDYCMQFVGDIKPEEIMMIGDSVDADIRGGKAYGMQTCWFDYYGTLEACDDADYVVSSLNEIRYLL